MDFALSSSEMSRALAAIKGCIPNVATMPILRHVIVTAEAGSVSFRATDLNMEATARAGADVAQDGASCLPGEILHGISRTLPKGDALVTIKVENGIASVTCGRSSYSLRVLPIEDFPQRKEIEGGVRFSMKAADLRRILLGTQYAIGVNDARYYLRGAYLGIDSGSLTAVGTDGSRMAVCRADIPAGAEGLEGAIIPHAAVRQICGLIDKAEEIEISANDVRFGVHLADISFVSTLIDGKFPEFNRLLPLTANKIASVKPSALADAVGRTVIVLTGIDDKSPAIGLTAGQDGIVLDAGGGRADDAKEVIDADVPNGGGYLSLNPRYLIDMLNAWGDEPIDIQHNGDGGPILFASKAVPDAHHVIMPCKRR